MMRHLHAGRADDTYDRRLSGYVRAHLVVDDLGLEPLSSPAPEDLYGVISERYEKGLILITSNRAPVEWASWFADPLLASAGLGRLARNAHVLVITRPSCRARGRQQLEQEVTLSAVTANSN
jgi:DNA replication protein DnaC